MFVISNSQSDPLSDFAGSPGLCVSYSRLLDVYNEFQWHPRLVLSEERAGRLQRPDDKQTQPCNCNKKGRRDGTSLAEAPS